MILRTAFLLLAVLTVRSSAQQISLNEVRGDFDQQEYRAALQKISRLLFSTNEPLPGERYELLMLKGECQLQLKDRIGSAAAFKSAGKAAANVGQLAAARANAVIVERSSAGVYTPAYAAGEPPIDILSVESRKKAMARLQRELWSKHKREIDDAMRAETLPPIERVFVFVADAFFLEFASTGDAKETSQTMRALGTRAFRLIQVEVKRYARAVDQLSQLANSSEDLRRGWGTARRGLLPAERNQLRDAVTYLTNVQARAREYRDTASRLGGDQDKWDALVAEITDALFESQSLSAQG